MNPASLSFPSPPPLLSAPNLLITLGTAFLLILIYLIRTPSIRISTTPGGQPTIEAIETKDTGWLFLAAAWSVWAFFGVLALFSHSEGTNQEATFWPLVVRGLSSVMNSWFFLEATRRISGREDDPSSLYNRLVFGAHGHRRLLQALAAAGLFVVIFAKWAPKWTFIPEFVTSVAILYLFIHDIALALRRRGAHPMVLGAYLTFFLQLIVQVQVAIYPFIVGGADPKNLPWIVSASKDFWNPKGVEVTWVANTLAHSLFSMLVLTLAFTWIRDMYYSVVQGYVDALRKAASLWHTVGLRGRDHPRGAGGVSDQSREVAEGLEDLVENAALALPDAEGAVPPTKGAPSHFEENPPRGGHGEGTLAVTPDVSLGDEPAPRASLSEPVRISQNRGAHMGRPPAPARGYLKRNYIRELLLKAPNEPRHLRDLYEHVTDEMGLTATETSKKRIAAMAALGVRTRQELLCLRKVVSYLNGLYGQDRFKESDLLQDAPE